MARAKYDDAKAQRELAEQKTADHKQVEADYLSMQQRLQDADAQLATMTEDIDQQAAALCGSCSSCLRLRPLLQHSRKRRQLQL